MGITTASGVEVIVVSACSEFEKVTIFSMEVVSYLSTFVVFSVGSPRKSVMGLSGMGNVAGRNLNGGTMGNNRTAVSNRY